MISKYAIVFTVVLSAAAGIWLHGNSYGVRKTEQAHIVKENKLRAEMNRLRALHYEEITSLKSELKTEGVKSNERIEVLLKENQKLKDWWNTAYPDSAVDYAF